MREKKDLKEMTESKVREFLSLDPETIPDASFQKLMNQCKVGMIWNREVELSKRIGQAQIIRVVNLISENKEEIRGYIENAIPEIQITHNK